MLRNYFDNYFKHCKEIISKFNRPPVHGEELLSSVSNHKIKATLRDAVETAPQGERRFVLFTKDVNAESL